MDKLNTEGFTSSAPKKQYRGQQHRPSPVRRSVRSGGALFDAVLVCAALSVFAYAASGSKTFTRAVEQAVSAFDFTVSIDDALGSLRYVSGGAAEVFGSRVSYELPVTEISSLRPLEDGSLILDSDAYCDVRACSGGEVVNVGEDFVRIRKGGSTVEYGKLHFVAVSKGQLVEANEAIGRTGESGEVELTVLIDGKAQDTAALLGVSVG